MNIQEYMVGIGKAARQASYEMAKASTKAKNEALLFIAKAILQNEKTILEANAKDVERAKQNQLDLAFIDRLTLTQASVQKMAEGLEQVAALSDPIGEITNVKARPTGISVGQMRVPLGVIGIIYESRPNVTIDAAALCIKSGNATILRGGSEAILSNQVLAQLVSEGLMKANLPKEAVQVIETTDRQAVGELITMTEYVDVIVPRGGKSLIARLMAEARVPMIKHLDGICHTYIDDSADIEKTVTVAFNAKCQRYGTCNTMETLLVSEKIAPTILPLLAKRYESEKVELRCDSASYGILSTYPYLKKATEEDWTTEYLAPILSIRVVKDVSEAIDHINRYSSKHTDAIMTEDYSKAMRFLREVDSSSVMINASTRFADGFEYGLGAEIGISNDKIHARGPVGLEGLTSQKYVVFGNGEIRQ